jgi:hypothetical protein
MNDILVDYSDLEGDREFVFPSDEAFFIPKGLKEPLTWNHSLLHIRQVPFHRHARGHYLDVFQ